MRNFKLCGKWRRFLRNITPKCHAALNESSSAVARFPQPRTRTECPRFSKCRSYSTTRACRRAGGPDAQRSADAPQRVFGSRRSGARNMHLQIIELVSDFRPPSGELIKKSNGQFRPISGFVGLVVHTRSDAMPSDRDFLFEDAGREIPLACFYGIDHSSSATSAPVTTNTRARPSPPSALNPAGPSTPAANGENAGSASSFG